MLFQHLPVKCYNCSFIFICLSDVAINFNQNQTFCTSFYVQIGRVIHSVCLLICVQVHKKCICLMDGILEADLHCLCLLPEACGQCVSKCKMLPSPSCLQNITDYLSICQFPKMTVLKLQSLSKCAAFVLHLHLQATMEVCFKRYAIFVPSSSFTETTCKAQYFC